MYARWSLANESYFLSIFPEAFDRHMGRGSRVTFRKVQVSFDNHLDHIYMKPSLSFWERTRNALRVIRGMVTNCTTEVQAQPIRERLGGMLKTMQQHTPDGGLKEVEEAKLCITTGIDKLDGENLHRAV